MTIHFGNVAPDDVLPIPFESYGSGGASITLTGLVVGDIRVYKDGSTAQRASTNGFTLLDTDGVDFDGMVGIHGVSIDLSDNSDAGFYEIGAHYWVIVDAVTIDGQEVRFLAATFRISIAALADRALGRIVVGSGSTTTSIVPSLIYPAGLIDNQFNGRTLVFPDYTTTANLRGVACSISDFVQATPAFTVSQIPTAPQSGDIAIIF